MSVNGKTSIVDVPTLGRKRWASIMADLKSAHKDGRAVFFQSDHPATDRNNAISAAARKGLRINTRLADGGVIIWIRTEGA